MNSESVDARGKGLDPLNYSRINVEIIMQYIWKANHFHFIHNTNTKYPKTYKSSRIKFNISYIYENI